MSSSNMQNTQRRRQGRIILGLTTPGPDSMSVQEFEGKDKLVWDDTMDTELIERVRTKAQSKAKEIIAGAMREAEAIRETARQEGFNQGMQQSEELLQTQLAETAQGLGQVLESIRQQSETIWKTHEEDIVTLVRVAVEKTIGVEIGERREEFLGLLLEQSFDRLESDRFLTIRCAVEDAELLDSLLQAARETNPKLLKWMVKPDPTMSGGVIVEAENAKVDNGLDTRWEGVGVILDQLALPRAASDSQLAES